MAYSIGIGHAKNGARHHCFSRERDRLAGSRKAIRYELFPNLDVMSDTSCRTASAHVVDMKENQLCCSARYNYRGVAGYLVYRSRQRRRSILRYPSRRGYA